MNPINDELPVVGPGLKPVLSCPEGQEILITAEFLYATDADTANSSLLFLIARQPRHGVVLRKGGTVDRFIQADVAAGIISYKHTGESATVCVKVTRLLHTKASPWLQVRRSDSRPATTPSPLSFLMKKQEVEETQPRTEGGLS